MLAQRRTWLWLIPLLLLAAGLGAAKLDDDLLFVDEYWSIYVSGGAPYGPLSLTEMWNRVASEDQGGMGMLYNGSLGAWESIAGASPYAARTFSLLVGMLVIAFSYRLGRDLFSAQVGLYGAAILGVSAFFVDYLHEARAYTLFALMVALVIWAYWRIGAWDGEPPLGHYLLLMLALAGLAYTHYLGLMFEAALGIYHLLFVRKTRRWWLVGAAAAGAALFYMPWLTVTLSVIGRGTQENRTAMSAGLALEQLLHLFSNGNIALLGLLAAYSLRERRRQTLMLWLLAVTTLALMLVVNARIPFLVHPRYLLMLWPLLAIVVGVGIVQTGRSGFRARVMLAAWLAGGLWQAAHPQFIAGIFGQVYRAPQAGVNTAMEIVRQRAQPDDVVIFHIAQPGFEHFHLFIVGYLMRDLPNHYDQDERMNNSFARDDNHYLTDVLASLDDAPYVWRLMVPEVPTSQRSVVFNYVMDTRYARCETVLDRPDMLMTLHARLPQPGETAPFTFTAPEDRQIGLLPLKMAVEDEVLRAILFWRIGEGIPVGQYSVAVHVEDAAGNVVAQADHALPTTSCSTANIPLHDLPSGEYRLLVGVYDWQSGARLPGGESDHRYEVYTFSR